jgi:hypothetical protein
LDGWRSGFFGLVIPAKAGIQCLQFLTWNLLLSAKAKSLDSRFRGNDEQQQQQQQQQKQKKQKQKQKQKTEAEAETGPSQRSG